MYRSWCRLIRRRLRHPWYVPLTDRFWPLITRASQRGNRAASSRSKAFTCATLLLPLLLLSLAGQSLRARAASFHPNAIGFFESLSEALSRTPGKITVNTYVRREPQNGGVVSFAPAFAKKFGTVAFKCQPGSIACFLDRREIRRIEMLGHEIYSVSYTPYLFEGSITC